MTVSEQVCRSNESYACSDSEQQMELCGALRESQSNTAGAGECFQVAVLFLSVAGMSEADRSLGGEPIKIGVQRVNAYRLAVRYGVGVVKEFVEIGSPATSLRRRPVLRRLLAYLKNHPDINYVVFPGEHRFARTTEHAELLRRHFCRLGVRVIHMSWFDRSLPLSLKGEIA